MNSVEVLAREINIMENSKRFMLAQLELFKAQRISIDKLIEANLYYIKDFAQTVVFHYEALQKLDDLERIALGNVKNSDLSSMDIEFETSERGGAATLSTVLPAELVQKVSYVTYSFESNGISDIKSFIQHDNFQVTLNVPSDRPLRGAALIFFQNGEVLKRNIELRI
ncbi:MAG: hypothetical protein CME64_18275 [Halobacteriovoraceae bacterium]|nr:hypothetical protein [Halobacteriovoraceae bacterium]